MRVFLAGATGAIGKRLVPLLVQAGHSVTGMTRSAEKAGVLRAAGADAAIVDGLEPAAVAIAVERARPEVIIHELTAIPPALDLRNFKEQFQLTNRLRTEDTDHLLAAARSTGARRFVAQSYAAWLPCCPSAVIIWAHIFAPGSGCSIPSMKHPESST